MWDLTFLITGKYQPSFEKPIDLDTTVNESTYKNVIKKDALTTWDCRLAT